jgi:hypothetical protein
MVFQTKYFFFYDNNERLSLFVNQFHHIMEKYIFHSNHKAHLNFIRFRLRKFEEEKFSYLLFQIQRFILTLNLNQLYIIHHNLME